MVVAGRKLVGSAQARIGGALLQHGSLLLIADQEALFTGANGEKRDAHGRGGSSVAPRARPVTLAEVLGGIPPWEHLVEAFNAGFASVFGGEWVRSGMTKREVALAAELEKRYGSQGWTWRR